MGKAIFLIVDDTQQLRTVVRRLVERFVKRNELDAELLTAASGAAALDEVLVYQVKYPEAEWCLITDYDMAEMNGAQLIDKVDKVLGNKLLLRLVLTGIIDKERKEEIEGKGAFIEGKPFENSVLTTYLSMFQMNLSR